MDSYTQLQAEIKNALNEDFQRDSINIIQLMSILAILGESKNEAELRELVDIYSSDFAALQSIMDKEAGAEQQEYEADVQTIVERMIKDDPALATELAKFAAQDDVTVDQLIEKFPESKKYL